MADILVTVRQGLNEFEEEWNVDYSFQTLQDMREYCSYYLSARELPAGVPPLELLSAHFIELDWDDEEVEELEFDNWDDEEEEEYEVPEWEGDDDIA